MRDLIANYIARRQWAAVWIAAPRKWVFNADCSWWQRHIRHHRLFYAYMATAAHMQRRGNALIAPGADHDRNA